VQFAVNPATDEIIVIEMNPRVSRSSALASKATGFPIAKIAARLAVGYRLDEIPNDITRRTPASFEPAIDYVVVKWPRFAFEKFPGVDARLSTHMKSVGEAMAIGRTFGQAFAKAMRSRELDAAPDLSGDLLERLATPTADRYDLLLEAIRRGASLEELHAITAIDPWYLRQLRTLALDPQAPFAGLERTYRAVDTVPRSSRPRRRTTTRRGSARGRRRRSAAANRPSVMILGSGPQPDRAGDRVRLLLRARGDDRARVGPRRGDGQLQSRDGLDGLRHVGPALLRAPDARRRPRHRRGRAA
jgi:carbamoyl-phosphate synthase large subunit